MWKLDKISKNDVTIVLPTLNEEKAIGLVIDELRKEGYNNIIVVDGYSSDKTVEIARSKGVKVIFQDGKGKGGAIKTAIKYVKTPYILVMDADHTYDPKYIEKMLEKASEYDEIIGMRKNREKIPWIHRIGNRIISLTISILMGKRINDPCSGMYLLKTKTIKKLELTSAGFDIEIEICGQIAAIGRITEIPIKYRERIGPPKLRARQGINIILTLLKITWQYNPVFLFSTIASLLLFPGTIILLYQLYLRYIYGREAWSLGWSWLGLILFIAGLQAVTIATISLMLKRMERRIIGIVK